MVKLKTKLYQASKTAPVYKKSRDRQRIDKGLDSYRESEVYRHLSKTGRANFDRAYNRLKQMTPGERARFYQENSLWIAKVFNYREKDEEGESTPEYLSERQLGAKVKAFEKQTKLFDYKAKTKKPVKMANRKHKTKLSTSRLSSAQIDDQIAELKRQIAELEKLKVGL